MDGTLIYILDSAHMPNTIGVEEVQITSHGMSIRAFGPTAEFFFISFFYGKPIRTWKGLGHAVDPRLVRILKLAWGYLVHKSSIVARLFGPR